MILHATTLMVWFSYLLSFAYIAAAFSVFPAHQTYRAFQRTLASRTTSFQLMDTAGGDFFDEISGTENNDDKPRSFEKAPPDQWEQVRSIPKERLRDLEAAAGDWDERVPKLNTVTLSGRVGNDPDPRYLDDGKVVLNLSLAVKRKYHPLERKARGIRSGEEETDWFPLEIWGQNAEYASKFVEKGTRIGVTGSMRHDHWTDKETGEPRQRAKIVVQHLDILESKAEAELRRQNRRGPSFYASDKGDDDDSGFNPAGTGGFFD